MSQRGGRHQRRPSQSVFSLDFAGEDFGAGAASELASPSTAPPVPPAGRGQKSTPSPPGPAHPPAEAGHDSKVPVPSIRRSGIKTVEAEAVEQGDFCRTIDVVSVTVG